MNVGFAPYVIPMVITILSIILTAKIAIIAFFIKRYFDQSDRRNQELHTSLTNSHDRLSQSNDSLKEMIGELKEAITYIKTKNKGDEIICNERHEGISTKFQRIDDHIKVFYKELNKK